MKANYKSHGRKRRGQTIILFMFFMVVLVLFVGMGIDLGFAYITRARLSKAVDAACLTGIRTYRSNNEAGALALAQSAFQANYGTSSRDAVSPYPLNIAFDTSGPNVLLNVSATAQINTFFIRILPAVSPTTFGRFLKVSSSAQGTRPNLIMTMVLDKSGSMGTSVAAGGSNGGQYLPDAASNFITNFDDNLDKLGVVTFDSAQHDVVYTGGSGNHQPKRPFQADAVNAVNALVGHWSGATFSQGGLTNALVMENNASISAGETTVKVVVFFTDGIANTLQQSLACNGGAKLLNFGGFDPGDNCDDPCTWVAFMDPTTGDQLCSTSKGGTPSCCSGVNTFFSAIDNQSEIIIHDNVTRDAEYRAIQVANDMRSAHIVVYSIAVGGNLNLSFLAKVANDPSLAGTPDYTSTPYDGISVVANDPSQLSAVFQKVADTILARLTK
ncbi:MAG TPA: pilus assembly protein TadG-related protein [Verrucomicrobiae bacterium]|nr:pilus assembly protein TadG-related protein [Verrucomicrobiae bacterium]